MSLPRAGCDGFGLLRPRRPCRFEPKVASRVGRKKKRAGPSVANKVPKGAGGRGRASLARLALLMPVCVCLRRRRRSVPHRQVPAAAAEAGAH